MMPWRPFTGITINDGFEISEKDLVKPGDLYGLRQHGMPHFVRACQRS